MTAKVKKEAKRTEENHPKISVLMPIYNAEEYLKQSLDSLISQTFKDLEIIAINDGSTDDSLKIIKDYAKKDSRLKIIDKKNSGYGASMNLGLKKASGKYIAILEPDDYIEKTAYEKLYSLAEKFSADLIKANYYAEKQGKSTKQNIFSAERADQVLDPTENTWLFYTPPAIWSALYKREFLTKNQIKFLETPGASYQDLGFNFKTLAVAKKVVVTEDAFLHYRLDNSNSSVNNPGKVDCVVEEYASISEFLKKHMLYKKLGGVMVAAKLGNYHWNLQRLSPKLAKKFYQTMRGELLEASHEGLISPTEYSLRRWFSLQYILKYPRLAYLILRLRRKRA